MTNFVVTIPSTKFPRETTIDSRFTVVDVPRRGITTSWKRRRTPDVIVYLDRSIGEFRSSFSSGGTEASTGYTYSLRKSDYVYPAEQIENRYDYTRMFEDSVDR